MTAPTRLYRWYDAEGTLLYVGISVRPSERAHQHIESAQWTKWAVRMDIDPIVHPDRAAALAAESAAIQAERPVFNISGAANSVAPDKWVPHRQGHASDRAAERDATPSSGQLAGREP